MAIRNWHVGKVVLLWGWGVVLMALGVQSLRAIDNPLLGFALIGAVFAVPVSLSVMTWRWLGGKENVKND